MATQISLRVTDNFLRKAKKYAKKKGFLNVQEFFREAAREKLMDLEEVKTSYLRRLESKEASTFLSDEEAEIFERELEARAK